MSFIFVKVEDCDLEQYKKDMQEAFQKGYEDDFGKTEEIILPKAYAPVDDENVPDRTEIPPVRTEIPPDRTEIPPDRSENPLLKEPGIEERILRFCAEAKNIQEIMEHLGYRDKKTVRKYLSPLLQQGRISMTIPDKPNSKNQKYITIK